MEYYEGAGSYDRETVRFFDIAHEGAQLRAVSEATELFSQLRGTAPRSVVVVATDQISGALARLVVALRAPLSLPVVITRNLPEYVGPLDVVVVAGAPEAEQGELEGLRALITATSRGAETVLAGPARGPIVEEAPERAALIPALPTAAGASPLRTAGAVWAVLDAIDQRAGSTGDYLRGVADSVDGELASLSPQRDLPVNPARQLRAFAERARLVHTGTSPLGEAVASAVAELWTARSLPSGFAAAAELPRAFEAEGAMSDPFYDPYLDSGAPGVRGLVPLKAVVWAAKETSLPTARAESVDVDDGFGEFGAAARLVVRAFAATALDTNDDQ
ncbi:hypothetical protein CAPI_02275 [Corynebacterium capitovis DSM 44611]|uniref:hypothetical protein n=1 Tax=Corynebacterium capitovis TaxID=131081 RepID=UPI00036B3880|nr:hypothetical protein [Corynebacterium capitovis]WKD57029.1 hypothetical protein CAPI_02275 [Corynebacterium capitovis DSM 44611]